MRVVLQKFLMGNMLWALTRSGRIKLILALCFSTSFLGWVSANEVSAVAVWEFDNRSPGFTDTLHAASGQLFANILSERLIASSVLPVIERERLFAVLNEQKLGSSSLSDPNQRLMLGRILGAQCMLFGDFIDMGGVLQVTVRAVGTETGSILFSETTTGQSGMALSLIDELATRVVADFSDRIASSSLSPYLSGVYQKGNRAMEMNNWKTAIEMFSIVVLQMPELGIAQEKLRLAREKLKMDTFSKGQK